MRRPSSDTEKDRAGKADHVKSSRSRQVKRFIFLVLAIQAVGSIAQAANSADLIFKEGNVYTVNDKQPRAEAIAVRGDRIVAVGSDEEISRLKGDKTRVIDLHA